MPTSGKRRGPAPKPIGLVLNVDLVQENVRTKKIPKITLTDCMYHIVRDTRLHLDVGYDGVMEVLSEYISKVDIHDHENARYEIVNLPTSSIFGRSETRKKVNRRNTNEVMPITPDYMKDYIEKYGIVLETKNKRLKAGEQKRKLSKIVPSVYAINVAVVVRVVKDKEDEDATTTVVEKPTPSIVTTSNVSATKKKQVKNTVYIPRKLEVCVLNPVMSTVNERECGITCTTSSTIPIGTVTIDIEEFIANEINELTGIYLCFIIFYFLFCVIYSSCFVFA